MNASRVHASPAAERILDAAASLLLEVGHAALTTRSVCDRAGVTAPTLYHHFGDKAGLLQRLAGRELQAFFARKESARPTDDPVADLMRGWDDWIAFACRHLPLVAALRQGASGTIALREAGETIVLVRLQRVAEQITLALPIEVAASALVAGSNTIVQLMLDGMSEPELDQINGALKAALMSCIGIDRASSAA